MIIVKGQTHLILSFPKPTVFHVFQQTKIKMAQTAEKTMLHIKCNVTFASMMELKSHKKAKRLETCTLGAVNT